MTQSPDNLLPIGAILSGPHWPDRVRVVRVEPQGAAHVLVEAVTLDEQSRLLTRLFKREDLDTLEVEVETDWPTLRGEPLGFRLAYTHDPQFAASVARIDPLPHQLEAVYHYMLRQPRLRFLLADDLGTGKTIMAGLSLKELKLRGAITCILIVAPANLMPQWKRELAEKFDEPFDVVDRAALSACDTRAWEIADQCVVSIDFAWRADVLESLARAVQRGSDARHPLNPIFLRRLKEDMTDFDGKLLWRRRLGPDGAAWHSQTERRDGPLAGTQGAGWHPEPGPTRPQRPIGAGGRCVAPRGGPLGVRRAPGPG